MSKTDYLLETFAHPIPRTIMGKSTSFGLGGTEPHDRRYMEGDGLKDGGRPSKLAEENSEKVHQIQILHIVHTYG